MTTNTNVLKWLDTIKELFTPKEIVWIDGSEEQKQKLIAQSLQEGELIELNQDKLPGCYLHRSDKDDVARVEGRTFIVTKEQINAGATNNWMEMDTCKLMLKKICEGAMEGRTMYVIPFLMGPVGSEFSKVGIQVTDSKYVVINMHIMARVGKVALDTLAMSGDFTRCVHTIGTLDPDKRYICHFTEENTVVSVNSGYGGNALLGKKCLALRMASNMAKSEDWLAEHMLILGIENPEGEVKYVSAAFPSACGKTNLAMLIPPEGLKQEGYKVWCVGDDIAWMRVDDEGTLRAINPENGFFGVAPGTSRKTNPNAMECTMSNTIFTNVALNTDDNTVWWEGMTKEVPPNLIDWTGEPFDKNSGKKAAHPNSRFTSPTINCPCLSDEVNNPEGVPISAIIFGGRRAKTAPLIFEAFDWEHGVFTGSAMASETTAAAAGTVGVARRDPMAMLPFCGYNMGEYFAHWLDMGDKMGDNAPKIFHVNWFRTDDDGKFLWPGFGENLRVLLWALDRCEDKVKAITSPIGLLPHIEDLDLDGLDLEDSQLEELFNIDDQVWLNDMREVSDLYDRIGTSIPIVLRKELKRRRKILALSEVKV